jgi:hypothetical protein
MAKFIRKHWLALLAAIPLLPSVWRGLVTIFDWGGRIDLIATKLHEAGGMSGILAFLLSPPSWLIWPAVGLTALLLLWDKRRNEPATNNTSRGRSRVNTWAPWFLIIVCPIAGALWLYLVTPGNNPQSAIPTSAIPADPIIWDFDNSAKPTYFLGLVGGRGDVTYVTSFQGKGQNNSGQPLLKISGYVRSDITNDVFPLFMNIGGNSVEPGATKGVPRDQSFMITVPFPRILAQKFLVDFAKFTFVFEYDGNRSERRFAAEQIEELIIRFERETRRDLPR